MDKSDAFDGPSNSQSVLRSSNGHYSGVFQAFDWHFLLLHGRYKIYIMIPIDLETFQMLHPSFHKKGERKPSAREDFEGLGINTEAMEEAIHGRFRKC